MRSQHLPEFDTIREGLYRYNWDDRSLARITVTGRPFLPFSLRVGWRLLFSALFACWCGEVAGLRVHLWCSGYLVTMLIWWVGAKWAFCLSFPLNFLRAKVICLIAFFYLPLALKPSDRSIASLREGCGRQRTGLLPASNAYNRVPNDRAAILNSCSLVFGLSVDVLSIPWVLFAILESSKSRLLEPSEVRTALRTEGMRTKTMLLSGPWTKTEQ